MNESQIKVKNYNWFISLLNSRFNHVYTDSQNIRLSLALNDLGGLAGVF